MTGLDYDGRTEYVRPASVPKPPADIWAELEAAGREAGADYATSHRYMAAHARYMAFLHDRGIEGRPDPLHGRAPVEVIDDDGED